jgi:hypothetical protein
VHVGVGEHGEQQAGREHEERDATEHERRVLAEHGGAPHDVADGDHGRDDRESDEHARHEPIVAGRVAFPAFGGDPTHGYRVNRNQMP